MEIRTQYINMRIGGFEVVGYDKNTKDEIITLKIKCVNCNEYKKLNFEYEKILKIKCKKCGRLDVVIPLEYYHGSKLVKDTITLGAYKYTKLRKEYIKRGGEQAEIDFIRQNIIKQDKEIPK